MFVLIVLVLLILCVHFKKKELIPVVVVIAGVILYIGQNNRMMAYIEKHIYGINE